MPTYKDVNDLVSEYEQTEQENEDFGIIYLDNQVLYISDKENEDE